MNAAVSNFRSRFVDHVLELLERADFRRLEDANDRQAAYKIRYDAYRREGLIEPLGSGALVDAYDDLPNSAIFGVFVDGELASTIRLHVAHDENETLPSTAVFGDVIRPRLAARLPIIDPTRFAIKLEFSRRFPELVYVTTRLSWLAMEYTEARYLLATIRSDHRAFYQRVFGHALWADEREYPGVTCKIVCMGLDFPSHKARVEARYPF